MDCMSSVLLNPRTITIHTDTTIDLNYTAFDDVYSTVTDGWCGFRYFITGIRPHKVLISPKEIGKKAKK